VVVGPNHRGSLSKLKKRKKKVFAVIKVYLNTFAIKELLGNKNILYQFWMWMIGIFRSHGDLK